MPNWIVKTKISTEDHQPLDCTSNETVGVGTLSSERSCKWQKGPVGRLCSSSLPLPSLTALSL